MGKLRLEIDVEDRDGTHAVEVEEVGLEGLIAKIQALVDLEDAHVFERDKEEPIGEEILKKKGASLIVHRCKRILVRVQYDTTKEVEFPPSATIYKVLLWAIGRHGFNLDDTAKAKANLMQPGADAPVPRDTMIGRLVKHGECGLTLDLTLRDFTNG